MGTVRPLFPFFINYSTADVKIIKRQRKRFARNSNYEKCLLFINPGGKLYCYIERGSLYLRQKRT